MTSKNLFSLRFEGTITQGTIARENGKGPRIIQTKVFRHSSPKGNKGFQFLQFIIALFFLWTRCNCQFFVYKNKEYVFIVFF